MFVKNNHGEFVNVNKVVAVRPLIENYCPPTIHLYTKSGNRIRFTCASVSDAHKLHKEINELLIRGPKHGQLPWTDNMAKWVEVAGNMFLIDQIECITREGYVVSVHLENTTIEILNHNDDGLRKCLNDFEVAFNSIGHLVNLYG